MIPYSLGCGANCDSSDILTGKHRCMCATKASWWDKGSRYPMSESCVQLQRDSHLQETAGAMTACISSALVAACTQSCQICCDCKIWHSKNRLCNWSLPALQWFQQGPLVSQDGNWQLHALGCPEVQLLPCSALLSCQTLQRAFLVDWMLQHLLCWDCPGEALSFCS